MRARVVLAGAAAIAAALVPVEAEAQRGRQPSGIEQGWDSSRSAQRGRRASRVRAGTSSQETGSGRQSAEGAVLFRVQNVGLVRDRDVIAVGPELGLFDRIQLRVLDNDIAMEEIQVVYDSGEPQRLAVEAEMKRGTRTRWLDTDGTRPVKEIRVVYRAKPSLKGFARIEFYGQYAPGWLGADGRARQFNQGWVLLGAQAAGRFSRTEPDRIELARNEGQFKRIRMTVKDRPLVFDGLHIVYGNGEEEPMPVKGLVGPDAIAGPFDLKDGSRAPKEIRMRYRSTIADAKSKVTGFAIVEVWGQH